MRKVENLWGKSSEILRLIAEISRKKNLEILSDYNMTAKEGIFFWSILPAVENLCQKINCSWVIVKKFKRI